MTENRGSRRKRGRQPEDTRASGYYSRLFREGEIMDMKAREIDGLMDEIALLRVWTRRVVAFGEGVESLDEFEQNFLKALDEVQGEFKIRR